MVAIVITLLLGLAIYAGLRWQVGSPMAFLIAVAGTLAIWGSAFLLQQSYAVVLPLVLGFVASTLLGLAGARAAWRARSAADGSEWLWFLGTALAVAPLLVVLVIWLRH